MVEHLGLRRVEGPHPPAPGVVHHADQRQTRGQVRGQPAGVVPSDLRIEASEEGGDPDARGTALGGNGGRQPVDGCREVGVGAQPVADGGLEAVVELEHVEGPVAGVGQVRAEVDLGHGMEVVVPGAPTDLVRSGGAGSPFGAEGARPGLQERRRVALAVRQPHLVQLAPLTRLQHGATEEGLDPQLDALGPIASAPDPEGAVVVPTPEKAGHHHGPRVIAQRRHQLAAQLAVLRRRPVGMVHPDRQRAHAVGPGGVLVDAEGGHGGRRPRLVPVAQHPEGLHHPNELGHHRSRINGHRGIGAVGDRPRQPVRAERPLDLQGLGIACPHLDPVHPNPHGRAP